MSDRRQIDPSDIMAVEDYTAMRKERRSEMIAVKRKRRLAIGPNATLHFENFDTMLYQVHEMVYTERGGDEQVQDELAAYNPLIPQGRELVGTFMLEYPDPVKRAAVLQTLGGIEETIVLEIEGSRVKATWEDEVERTTEDGKTSSIHFLHFPMTDDQAAVFKSPGTRVTVGIEHPNYGHLAVMPEEMRAELARDLD